MTGKLTITTDGTISCDIELKTITYVVSEELTMIPVETSHIIKAKSNQPILLTNQDQATIVVLYTITSPTVALVDVISFQGKTLLGYENGASDPYNCIYSQMQQDKPCVLFWDARDSLEIKLQEQDNRFIATDVLLNNKPLTDEYCKDIITAHKSLVLPKTTQKNKRNCDAFQIPTKACSQVKAKDMESFLLQETNVFQDYLSQISNCGHSSSFSTFPACIDKYSVDWFNCKSCLDNTLNDSSQCFSHCKDQPKLYTCIQGRCEPNADGVPILECQQTCGGYTTDKYSEQNGRCVLSESSTMSLAECLSQHQLLPTFSCDPKNFICKYDPNSSDTNYFSCQQACEQKKTENSTGVLPLTITSIVFICSVATLIILLLLRPRK